MDDSYAALYAELYRSHWWWRAREALILRMLRSIAPSGGWNRILDVGCGDGLLLDELADLGREVEGLESDAQVLSPESTERFRIHVGMLDHTFRPQESYDLVTLLDVLEHIEDPVAALRRCRQMLAPGGTLLLTVPAFRSLWTQHDDTNHHFTRYTGRRLRRVLREAGFACTESRYFFHWLVPPKLAVRAYEAVFKPHPTRPRIPAGPINRGLILLSLVEQQTLTRLRLIPGTSLLAVARASSDPAHI